MIRPGTLNDRITVQSCTMKTNSLGESVPTWTDYATVWASVEGVSAREYLTSGQQNVYVSHRVVSRWLSGMTQAMRIIWRGRTLEIISLLEHDTRTRHEAICNEKV